MVTKKYMLDEKQTIWFRSHHKIEAETEEECDRLMIEMVEKGNVDYNNSETEYLYDTVEDMSVMDNDGQATKELRDDTSEIWYNVR